MISAQQLGTRIAEARKRVKLTQAQVADAIGVARTTLVAIEKGERPASNAELFKLAAKLGTSLNDLTRESAVVSEVSPRFRVSVQSRAHSPIDEAVKRLQRLGERYIELERMHGLRRPVAPLESLQTYQLGRAGAPAMAAGDPRVEGEDAARVVRSLLRLGDEPVVRMDERLEAEAGLRIFYLDDLPSSLSAFVIWSDAIGGCVGVNRAHPPGRRRWSIAHELGHFLRDREAGDVLEESTSLKTQSEIFPEAFAKEFLLPIGGVQKRFAERCRAGKFTPADLHHLAETFAVSFQAMALRLEELKLLPRGTYDRIARSGVAIADLGRNPLPKLGRKSTVAGTGAVRGPDVGLGLPERFVGLAASAYDQGLLSEMELAKFLGTDVVTARAVHRRATSLTLDDGTPLVLDYTAADLRAG